MEYKIIRSDRKTLCMEVNSAGEVIVRSPYRATGTVIAGFAAAHEGWAKKHIERVLSRTEISFTDEEIKSLRKKAAEIIPPRVEYYSNLMGLAPSGIKITSAKRSFGSCSGKNSLCFSLYLMKYPDEAVDYVVVHELAHIKYKNHGADFYRLIEGVLPDYLRRKEIFKK